MKLKPVDNGEEHVEEISHLGSQEEMHRSQTLLAMDSSLLYKSLHTLLRAHSFTLAQCSMFLAFKAGNSLLIFVSV